MNNAEMETRFRKEYDRYIRFIKDKSIDKEVRWSFFNKCIGAVELASDLYLIDSQEYGNLYREAHDLFFDTEYFDVEKEEKLPFEEVPEEEQETFEIDDLPFPEVLRKESVTGDINACVQYVLQGLEVDAYSVVDKAIHAEVLAVVKHKYPDVVSIPTLDYVYILNEEILESLQMDLEEKAEYDEHVFLNSRLALEYCENAIRACEDKKYDRGEQFLIHNGVLVKGNPEIYGKLMKSECACAEFKERQVQ